MSQKLVILLALLATSCRTYNARTERALYRFERGEFDQAMYLYDEADVTGSEFLAGAEAGMTALAAGDWDAALRHLGRAAAKVADVEEAALVSTDRAGESLLSWTLNEGAKAYNGEGYERVLLHVGLGLAYLGQGKLEDVLVEVRLADQLLTSEEELFENQYGAGGLAHFLSAVAYEQIGNPDDAYIDFKRMEEKGTGGELVGRSLQRLAEQLGFQDDARRLTERFGPYVPPSDDAAQLVVIAGVGLGPFKQEATLDIPTRDGLLQWSVPGYKRRLQPVTALEVVLDGERAVRTAVVEEVWRVAKENLDDRLGWLAAKSAVRAVLKRELTKQLQKDHDLLGRIVGDLFTLLTERADLRAWNTLPDTWQVARVFLPPGEHEIRLRAIGGESRSLGFYGLEPGETMFVLARTLGPRLYAHPIGGRPVEAYDPPPNFPMALGPRSLSAAGDPPTLRSNTSGARR